MKFLLFPTVHRHLMYITSTVYKRIERVQCAKTMDVFISFLISL
jgi:hypothetical protein